MEFEVALTELLNPMAGYAVYWNETPEGWTMQPNGVIILQVVGGKDGWYYDNAIPSHKHARVQIVSFKPRYVDSAPFARAIARKIAESGMVAEPYGGAIGISDKTLKLQGSRQDFGFWYPDAVNEGPVTP